MKQSSSHTGITRIQQQSCVHWGVSYPYFSLLWEAIKKRFRYEQKNNNNVVIIVKWPVCCAPHFLNLTFLLSYISSIRWFHCDSPIHAYTYHGLVHPHYHPPLLSLKRFLNRLHSYIFVQVYKTFPAYSSFLTLITLYPPNSTQLLTGPASHSCPSLF
jgi:hypothetical protein